VNLLRSIISALLTSVENLDSTTILPGDAELIVRPKQVLCATLCVLASFATIAQAQYAPAGITQWSTQIQAGPVSIDMSTGAMTMIVPVRHKAGSPPFTFDLIGSLSNMGAAGNSPSFMGQMTTGGFGDDAGINAHSTCSNGNPNDPNLTWGYAEGSQYWFFDATGAKHTFTATMEIRRGPMTNCGDLGPMIVPADDGSGYTMVVTGSNNLSTPLSISLYNRDGLTGDNLGVTDPDGNAISWVQNQGFRDSLGQIALNGWTYTDENGNPQSVSLNYAQYNVATAFTCTQGAYSLDVSPTTSSLPSSIILPTGAQYTFSYESTPGYSGYVTGRPSKITLPSGGYIAFQYGNGNAGGNSVAGYNCVSGVIPWLQVSVNDGNGNTSTTTYLNSANSGWVQGYRSAWSNGPGNFTITETDSLGDVTTHYFWNELEEERIISGVNQGVLSTTITCYYGGFSNCTTASYSGGGAVNPMTQRDVYTYDGAVGSVAPKLEETKYDIYGNVTQVSDYDYGASYPPSTTPISTTTTTYDINGACGTLTIPYIYDRPCSVTTTNSSGATVGQTNYTYNATGHATQTSRWVAGSTYSTTSAQYNSNGTTATATDGNGQTTSYTYGACNGLLPTLTTFPTINGIVQHTSQTWDCNGGVATSSTDANSKTTTYTYADPAWRQTAISYPDGGGTSTTYSTGSSLPWNISTSTLINGGPSLAKTSVYDGLARVTQTQVTSDPMGADYVDTTYDLLGRVHSVSNPHRSSASSTDGTTTYAYDALDRPLLVTEQDGSQVSTNYLNNCTTVADENGNARESCVDGLGRVTGVWEDPGSSQHLDYETDYAYDALGNLLNVTQKGGGSSGWVTRSFSYDGLSRLTSAFNPESGTIGYTYDGNSNVSSKTSPQVNANAGSNATQTIGYCYDALNRLSARVNTAPSPSICASPSASQLLASYSYDSSSASGATNVIGRLTDEKAYTGGVVVAERSPYQYDSMGRLQGDWQCVLGNCSSAFTPSYTYDHAGNIITATPGPISGQPGSSPTFTSAYDSANRLATATSSLPNSSTYPATLFSATSQNPVAYGAAGLQYAVLGVNTSNQTPTITLARNYDNRLRVLSESDSASGVMVSPATQSTGNIVISGSEQQTTGTGTPATATLTISGSEGAKYIYFNKLWQWLYDTGYISVTVDNFTATANYGQGSTTSTLTTALAAALNASNSPVTAKASGSRLTITSKASGPSGDYSYTTSAVYVVSWTGTNTPDFSAGTNGSLAGGANGPTIYDSGTISATVNNAIATVSFGQGSTTSTIASALASALQSQAGSFLSASASGGTVTLQSLATGSNVNWTINTSYTYNTQNFSSSSFSPTPTGMTGGAAASYQPEMAYSYSIPSSGGYDGASNLKSVNDSVTGNWTYGYDVLSRLQTGNASSGPYHGSYGCWAYDGFGNRTAENYQTSACPSQESSVTPTASYNAKNQVTWTSVNAAVNGFTYDAAGNVVNDNANLYIYDMDGRLCAVRTSVGATQYVYDAEGRRVAKGSLSSWPSSGSSCNAPNSANGFSLGSSYVLGLGGEQFAEVNASRNWLHTNIFAAGKLLATYSGADTYFALNDWLGTKRAEATPDGYTSTYFSLAYGNGLSSEGTAPDATEHHYTGKERDTESGNDYFGKRYYASSMGRWLSPDPVTVTDERILNPANTLNLYAYGANNPLKYVDPDGQDITYFYDQGGTAGHAVLFAYNQGNRDWAIESFGPVKHQPYAQGTADFDMDSFKSAQGLRDTYAAITIQANPVLTQEVIDYIRNNPDPDKWAWDGPNCSTQCGKILQKFKLDYQKSLVRRNLTPKFLFKNLMMRYNPSQQTVTPSVGVDYGNSSSCGGGSCMFDLFWLSIKSGQDATVKVTVTNCVTDEKGQKQCDTQ
jgi:RHS repeat-associated protein